MPRPDYETNPRVGGNSIRLAAHSCTLLRRERVAGACEPNRVGEGEWLGFWGWEPEILGFGGGAR